MSSGAIGAVPLLHSFEFKIMNQSRLNGCVMCESGDGAVTLDPPCFEILAAVGGDVVLDALTDTSAVNGDGTTTNRATTITEGTSIFGNFTSITVNTGTARCYKVRPV